MKDSSIFVCNIIFILIISAVALYHIKTADIINNLKYNITSLEQSNRNLKRNIDTKVRSINNYDKDIKRTEEDFIEKITQSLYHLNPKVDPVVANKIVYYVIKESYDNNLPPLLILCLIFQESSFNHLAVNSLNATGLMQIIPKYHKDKMDDIGIKDNELYYIDNNIKVGVMILKDYFDKSSNIVDALQKYVGASTKSNASKYIENILSDYVSLQVIYF